MRLKQRRRTLRNRNYTRTCWEQKDEELLALEDKVMENKYQIIPEFKQVMLREMVKFNYDACFCQEAQPGQTSSPWLGSSL